MPQARDFVTYIRRYINDLDSLDLSTHSVGFSVAVRDASFITYLRRYLNDLADSEIPANALLDEAGNPILTEDGDYILIE